MTFAESKEALAIRLNLDYSKIAQNDLFSDSDLGDAIQTATFLAWSYRRWEFTLDALKFDISSADITRGYVGYPNTFEDKSVWLLTVEDAEWGKRKFADYKRYFSENPTATDEIWCEFQRRVFLNTNALTAGDEVCLYGKLRAPTLSASTDLLPFSPENDADENSGNDAIVLLAYADILSSAKKNKPAEAEAEKKKAYQILDILWSPMDERDSVEQPQDRAFFENVPDFFGSSGTNQSTNIANFP